MNASLARPAWMISRAIALDSAMSVPTLRPEPLVGPLGGRGPPRIHHVQLGAAMDRLEDVMEEDRVIFPGVRAPEEDDVRLLHLAVGARAPTGTEDRRQTDDARRVSRSVAAVDVVGAERDPGQLLRQEIHLVAGLRAAERADGVAAVLGHVRRNPSAARSSASSHEAGRRSPPSRTRGSVRRG